MVDKYVVKTNSSIGIPHFVSRVFKTLHQECLTLLIKGVKHLQPRVFNTFETRYSISYFNRLAAVSEVSPFRGRHR